MSENAMDKEYWINECRGRELEIKARKKDIELV